VNIEDPFLRASSHVHEEGTTEAKHREHSGNAFHPATSRPDSTVVNDFLRVFASWLSCKALYLAGELWGIDAEASVWNSSNLQHNGNTCCKDNTTNAICYTKRNLRMSLLLLRSPCRCS